MRALAARAVRSREARHRAWVGEGWVSRAEARRMLGLGRAQVDNLRRAGVLESETNPRTGAVRISRASVEAELGRRRGR